VTGKKTRGIAHNTLTLLNIYPRQSP